MRCLRCKDPIRPGGNYCHECGQSRLCGFWMTLFGFTVFLIALPFMLLAAVLRWEL